MNISLRQMRAFVAVTRTGSFTGAARQLNLTQSAASMLVQQLEEELGLQLFNRASKAITLTEAGEQLLPPAQRILKRFLLMSSHKHGISRYAEKECNWPQQVRQKTGLSILYWRHSWQ
jgi:DNA-binding transcriptional LysR family regulator